MDKAWVAESESLERNVSVILGFVASTVRCDLSHFAWHQSLNFVVQPEAWARMIIDSLVLKLLRFSPTIFLLYPELRLSETTPTELRKVARRQRLAASSDPIDIIADPTTVRTADGAGVYVLTGTVDYFIASIKNSMKSKLSPAIPSELLTGKLTKY